MKRIKVILVGVVLQAFLFSSLVNANGVSVEKEKKERVPTEWDKFIGEWDIAHNYRCIIPGSIKITHESHGTTKGRIFWDNDKKTFLLSFYSFDRTVTTKYVTGDPLLDSTQPVPLKYQHP